MKKTVLYTLLTLSLGVLPMYAHAADAEIPAAGKSEKAEIPAAASSEKAEIPAAGKPEKNALLVPVYVSNATTDSITFSIVSTEKDLKGSVRFRGDGENWEQEALPAANNQFINMTLNGLKAYTHYEFEIKNPEGEVLGSGTFLTQPDKVVPFTFAAMTDAHINPRNPERDPILRAVSDNIMGKKPDFVLHLGDNIQTIDSTHGGPAPSPNHPPFFYAYWRNAMGDLQSRCAQYFINGNWEGENGWHPEENKKWAADARKIMAPAPSDKTYPEGGSANEDYYAFTWSNALFVSLNATGYNTINHEHTRGEGGTADWTLGKDQFAWLENTLKNSKADWKFIFIHHAIGGNAGDDVNSRYARGGARAAKTGEQAKVHALMQKYGVQVFFYGHDHVFTDGVVDGIHYTCVGSAGAPWKFTTEETGYAEYIPDSGYTLVSINGKKADIKYISVENPKEVVFEYSLEKK